MTKISKIKVQGVTHEIKDNEAYVKPASGIPASDIASGVIPDVSAFITKSVNDLTNYYTKSQTYTQTEVNNLIGAINQFKYEIAASTSAVTSPQNNVLYLIGPTGSGTDKYEEYVYPDSTTGWVKIGDTSIDLSGYVTTTALNTALAAKQDIISDLAQIRSGATAGATAYQKPSGGIPASDIDLPLEKGTGANSIQQKGAFNTASGDGSNAEGSGTTARGAYSHAEGESTSAYSGYSHAEGYKTFASGDHSHAEGFFTQAAGASSHASGWYSRANGSYSHAEGGDTRAEHQYEHAEGKYNKSNTNTIHSVGIGTDSLRKNAHEIMQNGDHYIYGLGDYDGTNPSAANTLQQVINGKQDTISDLDTIRSGAALGATALQSHQDISGKADKSEMAISTSGDQTTITLKSGTSATVINAHQDISGKEDINNKVTSLSANSTDTQYPSAKVVYDQLETKLPKEGYKENYPDQEFVYRKAPATITNSKFLTLDRIYGKTLAWNQAVRNGDFVNTDDWYALGGSISTSGGVLSYTVDLIGQEPYDNIIRQFNTIILAGHKYYVSIDVKAAHTKQVNQYYINTPGIGGNITLNLGSAVGGEWTHLSNIITISSEFLISSGEVQVGLNTTAAGGYSVGDIDQLKNYGIVDLTLLYGSSIDGMTDAQILAKFESEFPGYHDYEPGKLISNDAESIETVGFNQWDESGLFVVGNRLISNTKIKAIQGATYYVYVDYSSGYGGNGVEIRAFDLNGTIISDNWIQNRNTFTLPDNCVNFDFGLIAALYGSSTYNYDICINLSDPAKNGTYEPYRKSTMQLNLGSFQVRDSQGNVTTITGGLKSAGTVKDEIVGNKYIKRVGSVDLGSLNYNIESATFGAGAFKATLPSDAHGGNSDVYQRSNIKCSKYKDTSTDGLSGDDKAVAMWGDSTTFIVKDTNYSSYTPEQVEEAISGVMLYYELATPIEYELVSPLVTTVKAGITEARISPNSDGLSAPMVADIIYSWDYDRYIEITENKYNKVQTISALSTDLEYPSAKAVYNAIKTIDSADLSHFDVFGNHLIAQNTANSYVVHRPGIYKIPLIYGNGIYNSQINARAYTKLASDYTADFVNHLGNVITSPYIEENSGCTASSAGLLWQTSNCINAVSITEDLGVKYLMFVVNSIPDTNADAVLYIRGTDDNIMWSWTIWMAKDIPSNVNLINYTGVTYTMMGLPFGAIWNAERTKYVVPLYQWGRKDPMVPAAAYDSNSNMTVYDISGNVYSGFGALGSGGDTSTLKTVANSIQNPNLFFTYYNTTTYNWNNLSWMNNFWNAAETSSNSLADDQDMAIKTIYDPSPVGYMLPAGRFATGFTTTGSNTRTSSEFNVIGSFSNGWKFKKNNTDEAGIYFPTAGYRYVSSSGLGATGSLGYWWSFAPYSQAYARLLGFHSGHVYPLDYYYRAFGFGVWAALELH